MKKFFDRYLFSRLGLQILFSVLVILLFSLVGTLLRNWATGHTAPDVYSQTFWGFRQITDGGSMAGTLDGLDEVASESRYSFGAPVVLAVALVSWLVGMVLYGFVAGAVANAFAGRKEKIDAGLVRYRFRDHGVVIGWDFQGVATVLAMLDRWDCREVVVLSGRPAADIRSELESEIDAKTMRRVFVCNGPADMPDELASLRPEKARTIVILGDADSPDHDVGNIRLGTELRRTIQKTFKEHPRKSGSPPIRLFVSVSDSNSLSLAQLYPSEALKVDDGIEMHVVDFCQAVVRDLFSSFSQFVEWNTGRKKGVYETPYMPLAFKRGAEAGSVHLVVSGIGDMAKALVLELAPLLGCHRGNGRITLFSDDVSELERFSASRPFDHLFGVTVEFISMAVDSPQGVSRLSEIVRNESSSVTICLTGSSPDGTWSTAARLLPVLRFENVRVLIERRTPAARVNKLSPLNLMGFRNVHFFGFTDRFFASFADRLALVNKLLPEVSEYTSDRFFDESFADGLLENLSANGFRFEYNPKRARKPVADLSDAESEALSRFEHIRLSNCRILRGVELGDLDDPVFKTSPSLVPWERLPPDARDGCLKRVRSGLTALSELYDSDDCEFPYIVERDVYRRVVGVLPDEKALETLSERSDIRKSIMEVWKASKWRQPDGREKSEASFAVALVPGPGLSRQLYRLSFQRHFPLILVLPAARDEFLSRFPEDPSRNEMARWIRNASRVVISPGGSGKQIESTIRSLSTDLLVRSADGWSIDTIVPSEPIAEKTQET